MQGQAEPTAAEQACEGYGEVCRWVFDVVDVGWVARFVDRLVGDLVVIALIILGGWLLRRIAFAAIGHLQRRIQAVSTAAEYRDPALGGDVLPRESAARAAALRISRLGLSQERAVQRSNTIAMLLRALVTAAIVTMGVMMILEEVGLDPTALIAGAGVVGIALGFGAQSIVRDLLTGLFMLAEDQFGVGDIVDVGEASGVVEGVTLRSTRIRDVNGTLWHVPNGEITRVGNQSQLWARTILDVRVAYDTDLDEAIALIEEVANRLYDEDVPGATIIERPEVWGVEEFGPDFVSVRLAVKTMPAEQFSTARLLRARLKRAFDERGIVIPLPQRTVWMRPMEGDDAPNPAAAPPGDRPPGDA
jgi:small conductance mechanosensitive channel